jgi:Phage-related minor tail protein
VAAGDAALSLAINITAVDAASMVIKGIASSLMNLPGPMGAIAGAAIVAGAAVVGIGASAAKAAGDFQAGLNTLVTSAGELPKNLQMVSDGILKISTDTGTTTQQLVSAMYQIDSGGQIGASGLKILTVAAEGAKTENADLTTVTKALMTTMADYHLPAQDASAAMNGLVVAVQNGRTTLQDMASAMGQVLPIASSMGMSFPKVAGALDALTNAGIGAQQGAQNLGHFISALENPASIAQKAMAKVGLSAQQLKDTLVTQGLPAALQLIEDHIGKHLPAGSIQADIAMKNITGGLVGLKTAAAITDQGLQATTDATNKIAAAFYAGGAAVSGWDIVQTGFNFQMDRAKAALDAFMIVLGQQLLPILTPIVKGFADFVTNISDFATSLLSAKSPGDAFVTILTNLGINAGTARTIFNDLSTTFHIIGEIASNVGDMLKTVFGGAIQIVGGWVVDFINGPLDNIITGFNEVLAGVADFTKSLSDDFTSLSSNATIWGQNLGVSFENGLISVVADIIAVVEQIAQEIANYLGFSSPTKKGPGSTLNRWGVGMMTGLAQGITNAAPLVINAVNDVALQLQTGSMAGGTLHSAATSMLDLASGDAMMATAISGVTTTTTSAKNPIASKIATGASNALVAAPQEKCPAQAPPVAIVTATTAAASAVASAVGTTTTAVKAHAAASAKAHAAAAAAKTKTSTAAAAQRTAAAAAKAKTSAAAAAQRTAAAAAKAKTSAASAKARASSAAAAKAASAHAAAQRTAAAAAKAKTSAEAKAQRAAQLAATKAAAAAAKAGPTPVAGAIPNMGNITNALSGVKKAITDAFSPLKTAAADARLLGENISNSFTGIQAKAQQLQADLKQFFDFLQRTFAPVWAQIADTWENHIVPDLAKLKKSFDDASPSIKIVLDVVAKLIGIGLLELLKGAATDMQIVVWVIGEVADGLTVMGQQFLWMVQITKPIWKAISDGATWLYDQLIGHSIIPDIVNGIETWFNKLVTFLPTLAGQFIAGMVKWWNDAKTTAITDAKAVWTAITGIFNASWTPIATALGTFAANFGKWWIDLKTKVIQWVKDNIWTPIQTAFNAAYQTYIQPALTKTVQFFQTWFTTQSASFVKWAGTLMTSFGQGLTTGIPGLTTVLTNVASTIKSILGIASNAQTGPLSNAMSWMPNLMDMFSTQIKAKEPAITSEVTNFANGIAQQFTNLTSKVQTNTSQINGAMSNLANQVAQTQQQTTSQMQLLSSNVQNTTAQLNTAMNTSKTQMQGWVVQVGNTTQQVNTQIANSMQYAQSSEKVVVASAAAANTGATAARTSASAADVSALQAGAKSEAAYLAAGAALIAKSNADIASLAASRASTQANTFSADSWQAASFAGANSGYASLASSNSTMSAQEAAAGAANATTGASAAQMQAAAATTQANAASTSAQHAATNAMGAAAQAREASAESLDAAMNERSAHGYSAGASSSAQAAASSSSAAQSQASASKSHAGDAILYSASAGVAATTAQSNATKAQVAAGQASAQASIAQNALAIASSILAQVRADASQAAAAAGAMVGAAASAAAQVAAMVGVASPTKEGPLSKSDKWMPNLMKMLASGITSGLPLINDASHSIGDVFMNNLAGQAPLIQNATTIMAKGVKQAFLDAATAAGDVLVSLKQKSDDIYAVIAKVTSAAGAAGIAGTAASYMTTTANIKGDIPISLMIAPPTAGTAGTAGSQSSQNMTIHIDLDKKTIGKYIGKYINGELRAQGGISS